MVEIGGKPILEHLINLCSRHCIKDIVISSHYMSDKIQAYFEDGRKFNVNISYSYESQMMGSAGAIKYAARFLGNDDFFVFNADVMTNVDLQAMSAFHREKGGIGAILVHPTDHPYDSDIVEYDQNFLVTRFFRPQAQEGVRPISKSGTHFFTSEVLDEIPDGVEYSLEKQLIPDLLAKKRLLYAYYSECYSKDMGTLERLAQVEKDYQNGKL
jgi:NDP-sugar pyrophosphorylase family protein